jgi:hypothetical protein
MKSRLLTVMRNDWRGSIGAPKSGRDRKIALLETGRQVGDSAEKLA